MKQEYSRVTWDSADRVRVKYIKSGERSDIRKCEFKCRDAKWSGNGVRLMSSKVKRFDEDMMMMNNR